MTWTRFAPTLRPGSGGPVVVCLVCATDYYAHEAPRRCAKVPPVPGVTPCHEVTEAEYLRGTALTRAMLPGYQAPRAARSR